MSDSTSKAREAQQAGYTEPYKAIRRNDVDALRSFHTAGAALDAPHFFAGAKHTPPASLRCARAKTRSFASSPKSAQWASSSNDRRAPSRRTPRRRGRPERECDPVRCVRRRLQALREQAERPDAESRFLRAVKLRLGARGCLPRSVQKRSSPRLTPFVTPKDLNRSIFSLSLANWVDPNGSCTV